MFDLKTLMGVLDCGGAAGKTDLFCCLCPCPSIARSIITEKATNEPISIDMLRSKVVGLTLTELEDLLAKYSLPKYPVGRKVH